MSGHCATCTCAKPDAPPVSHSALCAERHRQYLSAWQASGGVVTRGLEAARDACVNASAKCHGCAAGGSPMEHPA